jgi:acetamidase/formamidase
MTRYQLEPERPNIHGTFSKDYPPLLTIDPGDSVRYRTLDARWQIEPPPEPGKLGQQLERDKEKDGGHCLVGPVAIRGAKVGMTLVVHIQRIDVGTWGWSVPWFVPNGGDPEVPHYMTWTLDPVAMTGVNHFGQSVRLRPFMGVMGMPPAQDGIHDTAPPRATGGNLDCKELITGSTLYLPIEVDGGLFSVGDGHAAQGDGELSGTAIECPMQVVELGFDLRDDMPLTTPHAVTPEGWLTFGLHEDIDIAMKSALDAMLDLMVARYDVSRYDALSLAGVAVDMRITQLVNGTRGAHCVLPHGAIR